MASLSLSDEHELQVQAYLRFAKLKRDQHVRETLQVIRDFKSDHLSPGEMYNFKEISGLLGTMEEEVQTLVDKEIQHAYHTNALLVKILLSQAQANGLNLEVDTAKLENEFLLKQIATSEEVALSRPASDFVRRGGALGKLGGVSTIAVQDAGLIKEKEQLEGDVAMMRDRMAKMQEQTTQFMRERTALNDQIAALKDELAAKNKALEASQNGQSAMLGKLQQDFAALSTEAAGAAKTSTTQFDEVKRELETTHKQLSQARTDLALAQHKATDYEQQLRLAHDALEGRIQETVQFQQMRKIMQAKSNEVVDLRKKLSKYEPQHVPSADQ